MLVDGKVPVQDRGQGGGEVRKVGGQRGTSVLGQARRLDVLEQVIRLMVLTMTTVDTYLHSMPALL